MKIIVGRTLLSLILVFCPRWLLAADLIPPTIQTVLPSPVGIVSNLATVTVTFSEPVATLDAEDLLINGSPALSLSGNSNLWTFTFSQPAPGPVQFTWDGAHGISDLAGNRFD